MRWEKAMMDTNLDGEVTALPRSGSRVRAPSPAPDFLEQPKPDEGPLCQRAFRFSQRCASMVMAAARFHAADPDAAMSSTHAQEFVATGCEAMSVLHRSVR